ncbi:MAG: hypothetical protein ACW97A_12020 [Candidatus Thorarchaeota archaeon]
MNIDRRRVSLIALSALPLLIGSWFSASILDASIIGNLLGNARSYSLVEMITEAVVSTVLGVLVVLALFTVMQRKGRGAKRLVVAFVVSPILYFVSLFLGEAFLLVLFKGTTNIFTGFILLLSLGVSMLSLIMVLMDAIPRSLKNLFVAFYGSIFGIFLGITMITSTMFVLIVSLIIEDFLLTRYSPAAQSLTMTGQIGADPFDYTRIQSDSVTVGVGDFVTFSLISAHSLVYFPIYVWIMSMGLAIIGIIINITVLAKEDKILPAIPVPAFLAIFPWIIHITTLTVYML